MENPTTEPPPGRQTDTPHGKEHTAVAEPHRSPGRLPSSAPCPSDPSHRNRAFKSPPSGNFDVRTTLSEKVLGRDYNGYVVGTGVSIGWVPACIEQSSHALNLAWIAIPSAFVISPTEFPPDLCRRFMALIRAGLIHLGLRLASQRVSSEPAVTNRYGISSEYTSTRLPRPRPPGEPLILPEQGPRPLPVP